MLHIGDVATDFIADVEPEYEEIIEEYEEEVLVDGVPEAPADFSADSIQNPYIFKYLLIYDVCIRL